MMLAGFEQPSAGELRLNGEPLGPVPPHRRNMGVVFQNYALFPHLSVAENLAFPLRVRGVATRTIRERVQQVLALVRLEGYDDRRPAELSGGQQQRVALARALMFGPDVILMDEPLGALDKQLREQLQIEIKQIQRHLGVTVLYVTHDQSEALALSDRIALFAAGSIEQIGSPPRVVRTAGERVRRAVHRSEQPARGGRRGRGGRRVAASCASPTAARCTHASPAPSRAASV